MRWTRRFVLTMAIVASGSAAFALLTPNQRCLTRRLAAVARLTTCELRAYGGAAVNGTSVDVGDCVSRFSTRWTNLDAVTPCQPAVAAAVVADKVNQFVLDIMNLLNPPPPKIIFATRETMTTLYNADPVIGLFYYPSRADEICTRLAHRNPALASKVFKAAVCGREPDVAGNALLGFWERSTDSLGGYVRTDGAWIGDNLSDLRDGSIDVPISFDQYGLLLPDVESNDVIPVWTGCSGTGESLSIEFQCSYGPEPSWTFVVGVAGGVGRPDRTDSGWLAWGDPDSCGRDRHLYCIEQ